MSPRSDDKSPFAHWMLKEIYQQPEVLARICEANLAQGEFRAARVEALKEWLEQAPELVIVASGSSRHAGMAAEILVEDLTGIPVDVEYASEYTYRSERANKAAAVLAISQSGETADTLAALRKANQLGRRTLAITNVADSAMAREASVAFPTPAGRERAIPATKSFTAQMAHLYLLALLAGSCRGTLSQSELQQKLAELEALPLRIEQQLVRWQQQAEQAAASYADVRNMLFLGRGVHYPIAREGALKLKESAYLHAEGYPSGELKHGPNALVNPETPLLMVATVDRAESGSVLRYERTLQLMRDMRRQGAEILAVADSGDSEVAELANCVFTVEPASEALLAIAEVIPLQLFAYCMATANGVDVDHPRNLTKAVLAE